MATSWDLLGRLGASWGQVLASRFEKVLLKAVFHSPECRKRSEKPPEAPRRTENAAKTVLSNATTNSKRLEDEGFSLEAWKRGGGPVMRRRRCQSGQPPRGRPCKTSDESFSSNLESPAPPRIAGRVGFRDPGDPKSTKMALECSPLRASNFT